MNALRLMFLLVLFSITSSMCFAQGMTGDWKGNMQLPDVPLIIHIAGTAGKYTATTDNPTQNSAGVATTATIDSSNKVTIVQEVSSPFTFTGPLTGNTIVGTWSQSGGSGSMTLVRSASTVSSPTSPGLAGDWKGTIQVPDLPVVYHISGSAGNYTATTDDLSQYVAGVPATITVDSSDKVSINIALFAYSFTGTLKGKTIAGTWSQGGETGPLTLKHSTSTVRKITRSSTGLSSDWKGNMQHPGIPFVLHIAGSPGSYTATTDSPTQNASGIAATATIDSSNKATINVPSVKFSFTGPLTGNIIVGTWSQGGGSGTMTLVRSSSTVSPTTNPALTGDWYGTVQLPDLPLVFHISGSTGNYTATGDSPTQYGAGIPTTVMIDSSNKVGLNMATSIPFSFTGPLTGDTIAGTWSQGGASGPMTLMRSND